MKRYLQAVMDDKETGALAGIVAVFLLIFSCFYGIILRFHDFLYEANLLKTHASGVPVISVGNITLGGTGKTPFAIMLAEMFKKSGKKPAILIRGYGEDEWVMLKNRFAGKGVGVFVAKDRVKSAREAVKKGSDIIILDDGFQHRRLKRDIDIALVDSSRAFGNGRLFPRGILRETPGNLKRADLIAITKIDANPRLAEKLEKNIGTIAPEAGIIKAFHKPTVLFDIQKYDTLEISFIKGKNICLLSAVCDPAYFRKTVEKAGALIIEEFIFVDHHLYTRRDLEKILNACADKKIDLIVTTEKDAVKIKKVLPEGKNSIRVLALGVETEITEGRESLDACFAGLRMRAASKNS